ncbi:hypothetical protein B1F79_02730 [Coxiella-like endosymbiont of Rhipicephalus sanguineus]|nr:hypothetical protein [Coxiella-like endosymbiont of Rhipicephalus sanguineus]
MLLFKPLVLQALDREHSVVTLCGDGAFTILMGDFISTVTYKLPIKAFVFNNDKLGLVRMKMEAAEYPK